MVNGFAGERRGCNVTAGACAAGQVQEDQEEETSSSSGANPDGLSRWFT